RRPQAELHALGEADRPGQGKGEHGGGAGPAGAEGQVNRLTVVAAVQGEGGVGAAVPGHVAVHVVVGQDPGGGGAGGGVEGQRAVDDLAQAGGVPGAAQVGEVEYRVQLVRAQVPREPGGVGQPDLADQHPGGVFVGHGAPGP